MPKRGIYKYIFYIKYKININISYRKLTINIL